MEKNTKNDVHTICDLVTERFVFELKKNIESDVYTVRKSQVDPNFESDWQAFEDLKYWFVNQKEGEFKNSNTTDYNDCLGMYYIYFYDSIADKREMYVTFGKRHQEKEQMFIFYVANNEFDIKKCELLGYGNPVEGNIWQELWKALCAAVVK
ncbi:MAG: hypothetical protein Q4A29_02650 [Eubacteriales bacterium]|nr:hypothetical protein [Eubacteriales bacterium]